MPFIAHDPDIAERALHHADPTGRGTKPTMVFVVDHDAAVRDALSATLRASGFDVCTFCSAGDFLRASPIGRNACLLIDFDLVDMTGIELIARLDADHRTLPAVIMNARLRIPDIGNPCPPGVTGMLQKPFGRDDLLRCLEQALRER